MQLHASSRFPKLRDSLAVATAGAALAAGLGWYLLRPTQLHAAEPSAAARPPAPTVTVAPVEVRLVTEFEEITGRIDAVETLELRPRVSGHLEVIDAQRTVLTVERASAQLEVQRLTNNVALIKALGGGWKSPVTVASGR